MTFEADAIAANRRNTSYREQDVLALAERAAELGIRCHIEGFPFGEHREHKGCLAKLLEGNRD